MPSEWQRYRLSWRLESPLHIGYRTIGTIARTRLWVPGRNVWGALIDTLARAQGATSTNPDAFRVMENVFKQSLRFEAWFITADAKDNAHEAPAKPWYPQYTNIGLHYGDIPEREMQRLVLGANVSTAIDHGSIIAEEGMLFETEYIAPYLLHQYSARDDKTLWEKGSPLWLVGHLWAKANTQITIDGKSLDITNLTNLYLKDLSIGGEQKSGYGRLKDGQITPVGSPQQGDKPLIALTQEQAIPLLVIHTQGQQMRGQVEPIVGRTTSDDEKKKKGHGANLENAQFCWLPGSVCTQDIKLDFAPEFPGVARIRLND